MKRLVVLVLVYLLPCQFSWAAAATYCQHEPTVTTHFGHHTHEHVDTSENDSTPYAKQDLDCTGCHVIAMNLESVSESFAILVVTATAPSPLSNYSYAFFDRPERPKWTARA